jgi:hypothetical protein
MLSTLWYQYIYNIKPNQNKTQHQTPKHSNMPSKTISMKGVKLVGKARTNDGQKADGRCKERALRKSDGKPDARYTTNKDVKAKRNAKK